MKLSEALHKVAGMAEWRGIHATYGEDKVAHYQASALCTVVAEIVEFIERGEIDDFAATNNIDNLS